MRVGLLAKGLLLHDRLDFELVVLCSCRPTQALLKEIMDHLPEQLKVSSLRDCFSFSFNPQLKVFRSPGFVMESCEVINEQ